MATKKGAGQKELAGKRTRGQRSHEDHVKEAATDRTAARPTGEGVIGMARTAGVLVRPDAAPRPKKDLDVRERTPAEELARHSKKALRKDKPYYWSLGDGRPQKNSKGLRLVDHNQFKEELDRIETEDPLFLSYRQLVTDVFIALFDSSKDRSRLELHAVIDRIFLKLDEGQRELFRQAILDVGAEIGARGVLSDAPTAAARRTAKAATTEAAAKPSATKPTEKWEDRKNTVETVEEFILRVYGEPREIGLTQAVLKTLDLELYEAVRTAKRQRGLTIALPGSWEDRADRFEGVETFILREYGNPEEAGLTQAALKTLDLKLYHAVRTTKHKRGLTIDIPSTWDEARKLTAEERLNQMRARSRESKRRLKSPAM